MVADASVADGELTQLIAEGNPADAMQARHAFDAVRRQLFGEPSTPPPFGRYVPIERIGQGGIGVVYSAYDPKLHRRVAIKLLRPAGSPSAHGKVPAAMLLREAQALASVSHPNVVSVYDVGTARAHRYPASTSRDDPEGGDELLFIVMELVQGVTLREWLAERPRPWRSILRVFEECARGLAAAHGVGLVHRDFKPANVIVGRDDRPRVLDFGLARLARTPDLPGADASEASPPERSASARDDASELGLAVGTPPYMSPEQHRGAEVDARSDQFAFCASLWEALFGERAYPPGTMAAVLAAKLAGPPARPSNKIPTWVYRVLARGLSPDPAGRFSDMAALSSALRRDRIRRARLLAAGGAGFAIIAGLAALNLEQRRRDHEACLAEPTIAFHEGARDRIRTAFVATGLPDAQMAAAAAADRVDAFVGAWREERRELCELGSDARQGDEAVLRALCLERQAEGMELLVAQLELADEITVHRAVELADREVNPADCATPQDVLPADFFRASEERRTPEALGIDREIQRSMVLFDVGKRREALEVSQRALEAARAAGLSFLQARAQQQICRQARAFGHHDRAEPECFRAIELAERTADDALAINALVDIVRVLVHDGNVAGAELALRVAEGKLDRVQLPPRRHSNVIQVRGRLEQARGNYPAAMDAYERALVLVADEPPYPVQAAVRTDIANTARALGDLDRAIAEHEWVLAVADERLHALHPERGLILNNLGMALTDRGDWAAAHARLTEALAIKEHNYGRTNATLLTTLSNLGELALARGDFAAATAAVEHADAISQTAGVPVPYPLVLVRVASLRRTGDPSRAADEARALLGRSDALGLAPDEVADVRLCLGQAMLAMGDAAAAVAVLEEVLAAYQQALGGQHAKVGIALAELGAAQVRMGGVADGVASLERAVDVLGRVQGEPLAKARAAFSLAGALTTERRAEALAHARAAADLYRRLGGPADESLAAELWLVERTRDQP